MSDTDVALATYFAATVTTIAPTGHLGRGSKRWTAIQTCTRGQVVPRGCKLAASVASLRRTGTACDHAVRICRYTEFACAPWPLRVRVLSGETRLHIHVFTVDRISCHYKHTIA
jgi:hypothetical protein